MISMTLTSRNSSTLLGSSLTMVEFVSLVISSSGFSVTSSWWRERSAASPGIQPCSAFSPTVVGHRSDQLYHNNNISVRTLSRDQKIHNCPFWQIKSFILKNFKENFKFYKSQVNNVILTLISLRLLSLWSLQKGASHRNLIQMEDQTNSPEVNHMGQDTSQPDI